MTTEKHDPWALLREARETLHDFAENFDCDVVWHKYDTNCRACDAAKQRNRIDAALAEGCPDCGHQYGQQDYCQGDGHAEHADSATPVVEWCAVGDTWATAYPVDGVEMTVMRWADGPWKWWTKLETSAQGTAATEAEAKSAAIAAARGMR